MIRLFATLALFSSLFSAIAFAEEQQILDKRGYEAFHVKGLEKLAIGSSGALFTQVHSFYQLSSGNLCYQTDDSKLCYELICPPKGLDNKLGIVCKYKMNGKFLVSFQDDPRNPKNCFETTVKTITGIPKSDKKFKVKIKKDACTNELNIDKAIGIAPSIPNNIKINDSNRGQKEKQTDHNGSVPAKSTAGTLTK